MLRHLLRGLLVFALCSASPALADDIVSVTGPTIGGGGGGGGGGTGDVTGPASVTADGNIAVYNGTTGKIIKDSGGPPIPGAQVQVQDYDATVPGDFVSVPTTLQTAIDNLANRHNWSSQIVGRYNANWIAADDGTCLQRVAATVGTSAGVVPGATNTDKCNIWSKPAGVTGHVGELTCDFVKYTGTMAGGETYTAKVATGNMRTGSWTDLSGCSVTWTEGVDWPVPGNPVSNSKTAKCDADWPSADQSIVVVVTSNATEVALTNNYLTCFVNGYTD